MKYAICTIEKHHNLAVLNQLDAHNKREYEMSHVNSSDSIFNQSYINTAGETLVDAWKNRIQDIEMETGKKVQIRKSQDIKHSSVLFHDCVVSYSRSEFDTDTDEIDVKAWADANFEWFKQMYGEENLLSFELHMDETTPHIHIIAIPIDDKNRLNSRHFINGPNHLRRIQTEYAKAMEPFGLQRGERKSKAKKKTLHEFYTALNHIDSHPAPEQKEDQSDADYILELIAYCRKLRLAAQKNKLDHQRLDDLSNTRVCQAMSQFYYAMELQHQLMRAYEADYGFVKERLKVYKQLEESVPRKELDTVLRALLERYPKNQNIMNDLTNEI